MRRRAAALILLPLLAACGPVKLGKGISKVVAEDFAEGRVVDVSITSKLTGNREMLFLSMPRKAEFLEGYIQGVVTDYLDNPVQGVVVRARAAGETAEGGRGGIGTSSFDPGVSDTQGFYKIRFSLPILNNVVDVRGIILYSPGWEQERDNLGKAYEPQTKQSQFRVHYDKKHARLIFTEGIRKAIVAPVASAGAPKAAPLPGAKAAAPEKPAGEAPAAGEAAAGKAAEEDLFKGFGFGQ